MPCCVNATLPEKKTTITYWGSKATLSIIYQTGED
jgi:hypothetical protein